MALAPKCLRNAPKRVPIFGSEHCLLAEMRRMVPFCHEWHDNNLHAITANLDPGAFHVLKKVVLLALPGVAPFEFGVICEVFGIDRTASGGPAFDFTIATADPGPVRTSLGFEITITAGLDVAADADMIAVPAHTISGVDERYLDVIRDAHARGAWILSVCSGAFVLAEAGVLDGHRATTHWMHTDRLAAQYPGITVDPD